MIKNTLLRTFAVLTATMVVVLAGVRTASAQQTQQRSEPVITIGQVSVTENNICTSDVVVSFPLQITDADNDLARYGVTFAPPENSSSASIAGPSAQAPAGSVLGRVDQTITYTIPKQAAPGLWTLYVHAEDWVGLNDPLADNYPTEAATFNVSGDCQPDVIPEVTIDNVVVENLCTPNAKVSADVSIIQPSGQLGFYTIDLDLILPATSPAPTSVGHVTGPSAQGSPGQPLDNLDGRMSIPLPADAQPGTWIFAITAGGLSSLGNTGPFTEAGENFTVARCSGATPTATAVPATPTPAPTTPTPVVATATPTTVAGTPTPMVATATPTPAVATATPTTVAGTPTPVVTTATPTNPKGGLAYTGSDSDSLALFGGALVFAGLAAAGLSTVAKKR